MLETAFSPIIGDKPRVLILGSMPGVRSLEDSQYYAHPQNAFWFIMQSLFGASVESLSMVEGGKVDLPALSYPEKLQLIKSNHLALWDVAHACIRPGSLDSDIDQHSVVPNDFKAFLDLYPSISTICFNGRSVESLFKRHVLKKSGLGDHVLQLHTFPSTSPANARINRHEKLDQWRALLNFIEL